MAFFVALVERCCYYGSVCTSVLRVVSSLASTLNKSSLSDERFSGASRGKSLHESERHILEWQIKQKKAIRCAIQKEVWILNLPLEVSQKCDWNIGRTVIKFQRRGKLPTSVKLQQQQPRFANIQKHLLPIGGKFIPFGNELNCSFTFCILCIAPYLAKLCATAICWVGFVQKLFTATSSTSGEGEKRSTKRQQLLGASYNPETPSKLLSDSFLTGVKYRKKKPANVRPSKRRKIVQHFRRSINLLQQPHECTIERKHTERSHVLSHHIHQHSRQQSNGDLRQPATTLHKPNNW